MSFIVTLISGGISSLTGFRELGFDGFSGAFPSDAAIDEPTNVVSFESTLFRFVDALEDGSKSPRLRYL